MRTLVDDLRPWSQPQHLVVATDLSDIERLLPHAVAQAKSSRASMTLVHAISVSDPRTSESDVREFLGRIAAQVRTENLGCDVVIHRGSAPAVVQDFITETSATRLLIGTRRHGQCGPLLLGSVANALLFAVKIPVFTVGLDVSSEASATPRRILHPVSLRGHYREASAFALQLAQLYGAELTFMHLIDPSVMAGDYVETIFANTRKKLDELLPVSSFPPVHALTKAGDVTLEVLAVSAKEKMDWIVMEIEHDYPWWSMHNNHAGRVIAEAPCPVLTLRVGSLLAEATLADTEVAHAAPSSM